MESKLDNYWMFTSVCFTCTCRSDAKYEFQRNLPVKDLFALNGYIANSSYVYL